MITTHQKRVSNKGGEGRLVAEWERHLPPIRSFTSPPKLLDLGSCFLGEGLKRSAIYMTCAVQYMKHAVATHTHPLLNTHNRDNRQKQREKASVCLPRTAVTARCFWRIDADV